MNIPRISSRLHAPVLAISIGIILNGCAGAVAPGALVAMDRLEAAAGSACREATANPCVEAYPSDPPRKPRLAFMADGTSNTSLASAEGAVARNALVKQGKEAPEAHLIIILLEQKLLQQDLEEKTAALERANKRLALASSEAERAGLLLDIRAKEAALEAARADATAKEAEITKGEASVEASILDEGISDSR